MKQANMPKTVVSALIVDDNAFDRRRLVRIAKETDIDFFIREVSNPESFGTALETDKFDVIFIDLDLASSTTGFDLAPIVKAHKVNADASLIMIAGEDQAETALKALQLGFADYIDKDSLSASSLKRATLNAVQKRKLSQEADTATAQTKSIEAVLSSFAQACRQEMRPMLTRMVRQVRQMRSELEAAGVGSDNITSVENTCARMDEFLEDLGNLANEGQLEQIVNGSAHEFETIRPALSPRRRVPSKPQRSVRSVFGG